MPAKKVLVSRSSTNSAASRAARAIRDEFGGVHVRFALAGALSTLLPASAGARLRPWLLRMVGFRIGDGTTMLGMPEISGPRGVRGRLRIGRECFINVGCHFELGAEITVGDRVALGHSVVLLTTTHEIGPSGQRWGPVYSRPISIGRGAWLGAQSFVLPGVSVGEGAVVGAASLVTKDVEANTIVAGVPARLVRSLDEAAGKREAAS